MNRKDRNVSADIIGRQDKFAVARYDDIARRTTERGNLVDKLQAAVFLIDHKRAYCTAWFTIEISRFVYHVKVSPFIIDSQKRRFGHIFDRLQTGQFA